MFRKTVYLIFRIYCTPNHRVYQNTFRCYKYQAWSSSSLRILGQVHRVINSYPQMIAGNATYLCDVNYSPKVNIPESKRRRTLLILQFQTHQLICNLLEKLIHIAFDRNNILKWNLLKYYYTGKNPDFSSESQTVIF